MVHWRAEDKAINSVWNHVGVSVDGQETLARMLVVYSLTMKYYSSFGALSSAAAIYGNEKVRAHSKMVLSGLGGVVHQLDDIKNRLSSLSKFHAEKHNVDPQNFQLKRK